MFEPNSIRSLLRIRKLQRPSSSSSQEISTESVKEEKTNLQQDFESAVQVKLIIKQIQSKIESIREWRNHQRELMESKLRSNKELVRQISQIHMKNMEKQAQREEMQLKKVLQKLKIVQIKIQEHDEIYDSEKIFQVLQQTDSARQALKFQNDRFQVKKQANYHGLVDQINQINHIFKKEVAVTSIKGQEPQKNQSKALDTKLLLQEMDEIENQLKQIEELFADEPQVKKQINQKC